VAQAGAYASQGLTKPEFQKLLRRQQLLKLSAPNLLRIEKPVLL